MEVQWSEVRNGGIRVRGKSCTSALRCRRGNVMEGQLRPRSVGDRTCHKLEKERACFVAAALQLHDASNMQLPIPSFPARALGCDACNGGRRQQQRARAQADNPFAPVQRPILVGRPMRLRPASLFLRVQDTSYQRSAVFSAQPSTTLHPTCAAESDGLSARLSTWSCKRRCGTHAEYACVRPQVLFTAGMRRRPG